MRLKHLLTTTLVSLTTLTSAIYQDAAYTTDWHIPLLGAPVPDSTFFHTPSIDSKASLIYTLSEQNILGAIKPKDGSLVWRTSLDGKGRGVARKATEKVITGLGGNVEARRAGDGRVVWTNSFPETVQDVRVEASQNVLVLFDDGKVRRLASGSGDVVWEWDGLDKSDKVHSLIDNFGKWTVVSVSKDHKLRATDISSGAEVLFSESNITDLEQIFGTSEDTGLIFWMENDKTILKNAIIVAKESKTVATMDPEYEVQSVQMFQSSATSYFVHYQSATHSWLESYFLTPLGLEKVYNTDSQFGQSALAPGQPPSNEKPIPFTWLSPFEGIKIMAVNGIDPLAIVKFNFSDASPVTGFTFAISEVIEKADKTFAVRSFVTGSNGDTHLFRDGKLVWSRQESLAGAKHSAWVELKDHKTEEIKEEVELESHQNFVAAYIHRTTRHVQELVTYGLPWLTQLPKRLINNVLNGGNLEEVVTGPYRDFFGYRKYLVLLNDAHILSAVNVGAQGKLAWQMDLNRGDTKLGEVVALYHMGNGIVSIVDKDGTHLKIDAYQGRYLHAEKLGKKISSTTLVDDAGTPTIIGFTPCGCAVIVNTKKALSAPMHITIRSSDSTLTGYKLTTNDDKALTWSFAAPPGQTIRTLTPRPAHDPTASLARVNADRSVRYKYLNPHLLHITTTSPADNTLTSFLLDSVSGEILATTTHTSVDTSYPPRALVTENSLFYTFFTDDRTPGTTTKSHTLISTDLFESPLKNDRGPLANAEEVSSLDPERKNGKPTTESRAYILPNPPLALGVTATGQGITTKDILLYLRSPTASLLALPKRVVSALRPVGREPDEADREEGLAPYSPVLPVPNEGVLNHERKLVSWRDVKVEVSPSGLESTTLVAVVGEADVFGTRVSSSGEFDRLGKGFNRVQLVLTVVGLFVGVLAIRPRVGKGGVGRKWRGM
ncbi:DUF1620-domain-containing protein [Ascobolus immersus RN42]|uniref:ER membrane protein complex subunit 1 n=1 Tax=Ascobolus immersus RN42 TaxID=1160509 RepID=A0A3N4IAY4_ASCIM|nr:DUF1620-domain-containing protein [Ascobolus immersus RN42]